MNNKEEKVMNDILDTMNFFVTYNGSFENCSKSAQIIKDLSIAYLNITAASVKRGFNT